MSFLLLHFYYNIINKAYYFSSINQVLYDLIYYCLKHHWRICKLKEHYSWFKWPFQHYKHCLLLTSLFYSYIIIHLLICEILKELISWLLPSTLLLLSSYPKFPIIFPLSSLPSSSPFLAFSFFFLLFLFFTLLSFCLFFFYLFLLLLS